MNKALDNIYCYVDESGQHTQGKSFSVAVIVVNNVEIRDKVEDKLIEIEKKTKKGPMKWKSTHYTIKENYLHSITTISELKGCFFYSIHTDTRDYVNLTVDAIVGAIQQNVQNVCKVTLVIDGLDNKTKQRISKQLKQKGILYRKVRGIKDEGSAWIRLADAIAGFSRHAYENKPYTQTLYSEMQQKGFLIRL